MFYLCYLFYLHILLSNMYILLDIHGQFMFAILQDYSVQGRIQDFKLGGVHLKKLRRAEGGANIFGVFRVKNHDFTPKNNIFFQF